MPDLARRSSRAARSASLAPIPSTLYPRGLTHQGLCVRGRPPREAESCYFERLGCLIRTCR